MNAITLSEDVGLHLGIPARCSVPEMYACFEQRLHRNYRHGELSFSCVIYLHASLPAMELTFVAWEAPCKHTHRSQSMCVFLKPDP